jgi:hypothetical protein
MEWFVNINEGETKGNQTAHKTKLQQVKTGRVCCKIARHPTLTGYSRTIIAKQITSITMNPESDRRRWQIVVYVMKRE